MTEDWLVRWYDPKIRGGDAIDFDTLEEATESFKISVEESPNYEWFLFHYYNYVPDGMGGWCEPDEDVIMHWDGENLYEYEGGEEE